MTRALLLVKYSSSSSPAGSPVVRIAFWWQDSMMPDSRAVSGSTPRASRMHRTNAVNVDGDVVVCLFLLSLKLSKDTVPPEPMGFETSRPMGPLGAPPVGFDSRPLGVTPMGGGSKPMGVDAGSIGVVANAADREWTYTTPLPVLATYRRLRLF